MDIKAIVNYILNLETLAYKICFVVCLVCMILCIKHRIDHEVLLLFGFTLVFYNLGF